MIDVTFSPVGAVVLLAAVLFVITLRTVLFSTTGTVGTPISSEAVKKAIRYISP